MWRGLLSELATDRVVLVPDLKGLGTSEHRGKYDLETLAGELAELVLHELDGTVDVVGHGMGGLLGRALAACRPDLVRRLVVISTPAGPGVPLHPNGRDGHCALRSMWGLPWSALPVIPELAFSVAGGPLLRAALRLGWQSATPMDETYLRHYLAAYSHPRRIDAMLAYYRQALRTRDVVTAHSVLPPERALVVWGTLDPLASVSEAEVVRARLGDHASLLEIPGAGHFAVEEAPHVVVPAIAAFLREPTTTAKAASPELGP